MESCLEFAKLQVKNKATCICNEKNPDVERAWRQNWQDFVTEQIWGTEEVSKPILKIVLVTRYQ